jgi:hypothetical protein
MVYVAGAGDSRAVFCYGNQVQRVSLDHKPFLEEETRRVRAVGGLVKVDSDYAKQYRVCKLFAGTSSCILVLSLSLSLLSLSLCAMALVYLIRSVTDWLSCCGVTIEQAADSAVSLSRARWAIFRGLLRWWRIPPS